MENEKSNDVLHVVMFPFFAFGHISPFVQLANKLSSHVVKVSFFTASGNASRVKSMLNSAPTTNIVPLTLPQVEGLPPGSESTAELTPVTAELLKVALDLMQPQIKTLLTHLKPHFVLFDFAQEWLPKMADELGIKTVFYSVFVALSTAFLTCPARVPEPNKYPSLEDMKKPPPGFPHTSVTSVKTFEARDFLYIFKSFHGGPTVYDRVLSGLKGCSAILAKTCSQMEGPYIEYVKAQFNKPVFLVGPVVPDPPSGKLEERWSSWLNKFEAGTVIYCSFGSETFLKDEQIKELALGLEQTALPFFLVLNFPANVNFSVELNRALPEGFLERVKDKGIIHSGWVQQQHILAHSSVGCYVCHAGFSSVIEALVNDCQVVMLPQKGDQFLNAKLVSGDMKAGVEVNRRDEDGYYGKEDIKEAVEMVMVEIDKQPGELIRENQKKWKEFLLNKDIQCKFIEDLVQEMMAMTKVSST
uniref:Glycosyltransferase n=1 Tax=Nicotiana benthamiana TaxID=4100 RepID=A0A8K1ZRG3_NICBE|nr:UDP-glycosyltransferase [Nicotiana benthamiana]